MQITISGNTPKISKTAYLCESSVISGNVVIGERVFIAPNASIRADEPGSQVIIGDDCNVQDNVIVHALANTKAIIGDRTSLSHGSIVHGPIEVGKSCFIGFGAIIFGCLIGNNCFVSHRALVKNVKIDNNKLVDDGIVVRTQNEAERLGKVTKELSDFAISVIKNNCILTERYSIGLQKINN